MKRTREAREYTDAEMLTELRKFADAIGERPSVGQWLAWDERPFSEKAVQLRFGGWTNALRIIGFEGLPRGKQPDYSADELRRILVDYYQTTGIVPTQMGWDAYAQEHLLPRYKVFAVRLGSGTWRSALDAAGLPSAPRGTSASHLRRNRQMVTGGRVDTHPVPWSKDAAAESIKGTKR